jgi:hypothetical protein
MNLGLGNLKELKAWLLNEQLRPDTSWDAQIMAIGRGTAAAFERTCNRKFERVVGAVADFSADRAHLVLPRYPLEEVALVEFRDTPSAPWENVTSSLATWSSASGLLEFSSELGDALSRVRVTFTGGYWFDTSEDASGVMPAGAEALPADLKLAWLQHCRSTWAKYPKLGTPINTVPQATALVTMNFSPDVAETLQAYRRIQLR